MVDDSADCEFSLRVTNPTGQTIETLSLALTPSLEFNLATFMPVAWSHPYKVEFRHSGEVFIQAQGIGLPPGSDFCFRFRLKMYPKPGYAFASIAGQAYFDNQGPFDLYEAFYNVASENVFLTNEATPASTDANVRLFGASLGAAIRGILSATLLKPPTAMFTRRGSSSTTVKDAICSWSEATPLAKESGKKPINSGRGIFIPPCHLSPDSFQLRRRFGSLCLASLQLQYHNQRFCACRRWGLYTGRN